MPNEYSIAIHHYITEQIHLHLQPPQWPLPPVAMTDLFRPALHEAYRSLRPPDWFEVNTVGLAHDIDSFQGFFLKSCHNPEAAGVVEARR